MYRNLWGEIMWQIILAFFISLMTCLMIGPVMIPALRRLKFGQSVRNDGAAASPAEAGHTDNGRCYVFFQSYIRNYFSGAR